MFKNEFIYELETSYGTSFNLTFYIQENSFSDQEKQ